MAEVHKIDGEKVTADRIASALIDRLIRQEKQIESLQKQINDNWESYVETLPRIGPDGKLVYHGLLKDASDGVATSTVEVQPSKITSDE